MKFTTARKISIPCFFLAFAAAIGLWIAPEAYADLFIAAFLVLAVLGALVLLLFYRCPYCKKRFPMKDPIGTTACPHCGQELGTKI